MRRVHPGDRRGVSRPATFSVARPTFLLLLAFLASSCASSGRGGGEEAEASPSREDLGIPEDALVVAVENRNFHDALVTAESRQGQRRLGYVKGKGARTFVVEPGFASDGFQVRVRSLERARECVQRYPGGPGQVIRIILHDTFERSPICF